MKGQSKKNSSLPSYRRPISEVVFQEALADMMLDRAEAALAKGKIADARVYMNAVFARHPRNARALRLEPLLAPRLREVAKTVAAAVRDGDRVVAIHRRARARVLSQEPVFLPGGDARLVTTRAQLRRLIGKFRKEVARAPIAGTVSLLYGFYVRRVVRASTILTDIEREFILEAGRIALKRPFPVVRWINSVERALSAPRLIAWDLDLCLAAKASLPQQIKRVAERSWRRIVTSREKPALVLGASDNIKDLLEALPDVPVEFVPKLGVRGTSNYYYRDALGKEWARRARPISREHARATCAAGGYGALLLACPALGPDERGDGFIRIQTAELEALYELLRPDAKRHGIPVSVVAGSYKLWAGSTFDENIRPHMKGYVRAAGAKVDFLVTERDVLNAREGISDYMQACFVATTDEMANLLHYDGGTLLRDMLRDRRAFLRANRLVSAAIARWGVGDRASRFVADQWETAIPADRLNVAVA